MPRFVGLVIPTKDNQSKLEKTLSVFANQDGWGCPIIVVATGKDVSQVVKKFKPALDVEYMYSSKGGQVYQRGLGIEKLLAEGFRYIGFWDDDLIPEPDCLKVLETFISKKNDEGLVDFGVGLNIQNETALADLPFRSALKALRRIGSRPGEITVTGMNTPIANIASDTKTEWLGGGYTFWSANILRRHPQTPMNTVHAAGEDLIYSYPLGKQYPLFVIADAKVIHNDDGKRSPSLTAFREKRATIAHLYFCNQHEEFSQLRYIVCEFIIRVGLFLIPQSNAFQKMHGFLSGLMHYFRHKNKGWAVLDD